MLGVDIDKPGRELLEHSYGDRGIVHEAPRAAGSRNGPADRQMIPVPFQVVLLDQAGKQRIIFHIEFRLDDTAFSMVADHRDIRLRPEHEGKRPEQD